MNIKAKTTCYCARLRRSVNLMTKYYNQKMCSSGLSLKQYFLLVNLLSIGPCNITELAEYIELDRSTVVRNLKPLFGKGFIEDLSSPNSRDKAISVTQAGKETLKIANPLWLSAQTAIAESIGENEIEQALKVLENIEEV